MTQSKKPKPPIVSAADGPEKTQKFAKTAKRWDGRNGLGVYIETPETNPENKVLEYDDDFVVITDKYPKARYVTAGLKNEENRWADDN
jgi:aprataxin